LNTTPTLARPHIVSTIGAAALSSCVAIGLLAAVADIFQRDGAPFKHVVIAEQACAHHVFVSERATCVRLYLAASRFQVVASR